MKVSSERATLDLLDGSYLVIRIAFVTALVGLYAMGAFRFEGDDAALLGALLVAGVTLATVVSAGSVIARIGFRQPAERIVWWALPLDLVSAGMLIAAWPAQDPFYAWVLGLALAGSAISHRRDAWKVAAASGAVYLLAHLVAPTASYDAGSVGILVLKTLSLAFTGLVASSAMRSQAEREERLLASQMEVGDLNEQLSRRLAELNAVSEITELIHSTLDFDRVGPLVLDILSKVLDLPASTLFVVEKDRDETLFSASAGMAPAVAQGLSDAYVRGNDGQAAEAFACITLIDHQRLMVVLCAAGDRIERIGEEDRLVLQAVANELVVAVENSRLYKLTKRLSITDELTGLYNYRYLQQRLDDEIERGRRYGRSLSLLMLDVDDFKGFNDRYGHIAGDQALSDIGAVLRAAVREIDIACRYGGEEFAVLLPETDAEGAFVVAEKIREEMSLHEFSDGAGDAVRLTISIGVATYPAEAADREELLRQADDALYQAKASGRDRVRAPSGEMVRLDEGDTGGGE